MSSKSYFSFVSEPYADFDGKYLLWAIIGESRIDTHTYTYSDTYTYPLLLEFKLGNCACSQIWPIII